MFKKGYKSKGKLGSSKNISKGYDLKKAEQISAAVVPKAGQKKYGIKKMVSLAKKG